MLEENTLKETQAIFEKLFLELFLDSSKFNISGTIFDPESEHIIPFSHCDNCRGLRPRVYAPIPSNDRGTFRSLGLSEGPYVPTFEPQIRKGQQCSTVHKVSLVTDSIRSVLYRPKTMSDEERGTRPKDRSLRMKQLVDYKRLHEGTALHIDPTPD